MIAIFLKDVRGYFNSPMAWIMTGGYLIVIGLWFFWALLIYSEASVASASSPMGGSQLNVMDRVFAPVAWWMGFMLMLMLPLLTMRLFAEERRSGTLELLFTYPVTEAQIVLGKFLAAMSVVAMMLGFSFFFVLLLSKLTVLEWKVVATGYLGLFLISSCFTMLGLWASSLSANQMIAAVVSEAVLFGLWLLSISEDKIQWLKDLIGDPSAMGHLENMARGQINSHDLVYCVAWSALFFFLTIRVLESRKWRG